jgi:hypothetical protein
VIAELLDDIVPLESTPRMRSWSTDISDVFAKLTAPFEEHCHPGRAVDAVRFRRNEASGSLQAYVYDDDGVEEVFDKVIFACSAPAMLDALHGPDGQGFEPQEAVTEAGATATAGDWWSPRWPGERFKHWLEAYCLKGVMYTTERDPTFKMGEAHSVSSAVCPAQWESEIMANYCNYVEVDSTKPGPAPHLPYVENTFVISSWAPAAQKPEVQGKLPMLVSYNCRKKLDGCKIERPVTSFEGHPCLTKFHLMASALFWPMLQGSREGSVYFCGSSITPGNGHDLSYLSGLVAAGQIGAEFPYEHHEAAAADYQKLRGMMLWG